jgi:hypothetical protein
MRGKIYAGLLPWMIFLRKTSVAIVFDQVKFTGCPERHSQLLEDNRIFLAFREVGLVVLRRPDTM